MDGAISNWGDAVTTSLTRALSSVTAAIPNILAFIAIIIVGWIVAGLLASALVSVLRTVKFNRLARNSGFSDFVEGMGVKTSATVFIGEIAKWFVRLIALVVAFDALGLPAVSNVLEQLLLWLPNLAVALVILVIGGLIAKAVGGLAQSSAREAGFARASLIGTIARASIWAFAIIVAVNELGIAENAVNALLVAVLAATSLGLGLAFGLGGQEAAADIIADSRRRFRDAGPKLVEAASIARDEARDGGDEQRAAVRRAETEHRARTGRERQPDEIDVIEVPPAGREQRFHGKDDNTDIATSGAAAGAAERHATEPRNHRKQWSEEDLQTLKEMAGHQASTREIALRLERTEEAVAAKAQERNIAVAPQAHH